MEIKVKSHGIEVDLWITDLDDCILFTIEHRGTGLVNMHKISYSEMSNSYIPIVQDRIYRVISEIKAAIETLRV